MPGVNFEVARREVSMAQVLRLLQFEHTSIQGDKGTCVVTILILNKPELPVGCVINNPTIKWWKK